MKFKEIIDQEIPKEEKCKLNLMSFTLTAPQKSSKRIAFERVGAASDFYNSHDVTRGNFYKHTSLILPITTNATNK